MLANAMVDLWPRDRQPCLDRAELPVRVLAGDLGDAIYVDVDALRTLHARQSQT